jgi:hypothetical protein
LEKIQDCKEKNDLTFWSHLNNQVLTEKEKIVQELYKYYTEQFKPPTIDSNDAHYIEIEEEFKEIIKSFSIMKEEIQQTNVKEIGDSIRSLKAKKSSGYDSVSNYMLKLLPPGYTQCRYNCFNLWLKECKFSQQWKVAKVISLNKLNTADKNP